MVKESQIVNKMQGLFYFFFHLFALIFYALHLSRIRAAILKRTPILKQLFYEFLL